MVREKTAPSASRKSPRGQRSPRGRRGPAGPPGQDGQTVLQLASILARVAQELEDVQRNLRVQFTRIAELQADLDDIRAAVKQLD